MNYNTGVNECRWMRNCLMRKSFVFVFLATLIILSFALKFQSWAETDYFTPAGMKESDYPAFTEINDLLKCNMRIGYPSALADIGPISASIPTDYPYYFIYWFNDVEPNLADITWSAITFRIYFSAQPFSLEVDGTDKHGHYDFKVLASDDALIQSCYRDYNGDLHGFKTITPGLGTDGFMVPELSFISPNVQVVMDGKVYTPSGSTGGNSDFAYDSDIPAPQNLKFSSKQSGGIIKPLTIDHILSWTNALVDSYSVRVSVNGTYKDSEGSSFPFNLMMASDGSDGADAGVPASDGSVSFTLSDIMKEITHKYPSQYMVKSVSPQEYRVQFYKYDAGKLSVGPVGVVSVTRNNSGIWVGTSSTIEYPVNKDNLGDSAGLYPSGDNWTSDGQGFQDYDSNGNLIGSGTVGDPDSYTPSDRPTQSIGDMLNSFFESLMNIPTLITQLFNSLRDTMSGIGQLPGFFAQVVSWLPADIISLIGLGIVVVIVLRIFGR